MSGKKFVLILGSLVLALMFLATFVLFFLPNTSADLRVGASVFDMLTLLAWAAFVESGNLLK